MATVNATRGIEEIAAAHPPGREGLIATLQEIQDTHGFLAPETIDELAALVRCSPNEIYGVATFYTRFRFAPPARHTIRICLGTACHVCGAPRVLEELVKELGIRPGQVTSDGKFGLERVACVGCCALSPVMMVDDEVHSGVKARQIKTILKGVGR